MKQVTDVNEIKNLLAKYHFEMFNAPNRYEGEMTVLNEKDIDDILYDMSLGALSPVLFADENSVVVKYPNDKCTLESREERK